MGAAGGLASRRDGARGGSAGRRGRRRARAPPDGPGRRSASPPLHGRSPDGPLRTDARLRSSVPSRRPLARGGAAGRRLDQDRRAAPPRLRPYGARRLPAVRKETKVKVEVDVLTEPLLPSPDVVSRRVAGEYLLVPVRSGVAQIDYLFTANETGSEIFRLLDGTRDGRAIARQLSHDFGVDEERAQ